MFMMIALIIMTIMMKISYVSNMATPQDRERDRFEPMHSGSCQSCLFAIRYFVTSKARSCNIAACALRVACQARRVSSGLHDNTARATRPVKGIPHAACLRWMDDRRDDCRCRRRAGCGWCWRGVVGAWHRVQWGVIRCDVYFECSMRLLLQGLSCVVRAGAEAKWEGCPGFKDCSLGICLCTTFTVMYGTALFSTSPGITVPADVGHDSLGDRVRGALAVARLRGAHCAVPDVTQ